MGSATVRNLADSYVRQSTPKKNYGTANRLYVGTGFYSYIYFGNPIPAKAKVVSAKLYFRNSAVWAGSVTASVQLLNGSWSANKVNWNNDPGVTADAAVSQAKTGAAASTLWEIDVTTLMQAVANGRKWYGFRLTANGAAIKPLFSMQAVASRRPYLVITWSDAPLPPSDQVPRSGSTIGTNKPIMSWDFNDVSGNRNQAAFQVQIDDDNTFASPVHDSGVVSSGLPQYDLTSTATAPVGPNFGATSGVTYYWRVKTQDGAGLWSDWSKTESFKYLAPGSVTITSPSSGTPLVKESTPLLGWTTTFTQTAYQVILFEDSTNKLLWDSGKVNSVNNFATVPAGKITKQGGFVYRLVVRAWDDQNRQTVPSFPAYVEANQNFTYVYDASVGPVLDIAAAMDSLKLSTLITVHRTTAPDYFTLVRDGVVVASNLIPINYQDPVDPTKYVLIDYPPGRKSTSWQVVPVVNGVSASANPTATLTVYRPLSWLCDEDGGHPVALLEFSDDLEDGELSEIMQSQSGPPILVTQSLFGEQGSMSGRIANLQADFNIALTAQQQRDNLRTIRDDYGGRCRVMFQDESWLAYIYNIKVGRIGIAGGKTTEYNVSFDIFESE